jgi:hypothetical protein
MTPEQEKKGWQVTELLLNLIENEPDAFGLVIPCIMAHWLRVSNSSVEELSADIAAQLRDQIHGQAPASRPS